MSEPLYAVVSGTYEGKRRDAGGSPRAVLLPCQDIIEAPEGLPLADAFKVAQARAGWGEFKVLPLGGYRQDGARGPA